MVLGALGNREIPTARLGHPHRPSHTIMQTTVRARARARMPSPDGTYLVSSGYRLAGKDG